MRSKRAPNIRCEVASIARVRAAPGSRLISDAEFGAIVRAGLAATLDPANAVVLGLDARQIDAGTAAALVAPPEEPERRIAQTLVNRKVRDAVFRVAVCAAYDNRCAVTGLRIITVAAEPKRRPPTFGPRPRAGRTSCRTG